MPRRWPFLAGTACRYCGRPIERAQKDPVCRACDASRARDYRKRPHVRAAKVNQFRLRAYGVTADEYDRLLTAQGGVCAVCLRPERALRGGIPKTLSVDHDHGSGVVRGLLCQSCNTALGLLDDDPVLLAAASFYLLRRQP